MDAACSGEDSVFRPVLKPYQLVGVNFLLLLYRKKIGGGTFYINSWLYLYLLTIYTRLIYFLVNGIERRIRNLRSI